MTADDIDDGLPRLPIFDGTKQPQHRPAPSKLTLTAYPDRAARPDKIPAAAEEIRAVLARHGGADVEIGNPRTTLEDLFLDVVRDAQARPGRRARADRGA